MTLLPRLRGYGKQSPRPRSDTVMEGLMTYDYDKISACLHMIEEIQVSGTDNMLKLLFIKQTLQSPKKEGKKDASGST